VGTPGAGFNNRIRVPSREMTTDGPAIQLIAQDASVEAVPGSEVNEHDTLKYHLLGPSLTKAGQDSVDQQKVSLQCLNPHASYFTSTNAGLGCRSHLQRL